MLAFSPTGHGANRGAAVRRTLETPARGKRHGDAAAPLWLVVGRNAGGRDAELLDDHREGGNDAADAHDRDEGHGEDDLEIGIQKDMFSGAFHDGSSPPLTLGGFFSRVLCPFF